MFSFFFLLIIIIVIVKLLFKKKVITLRVFGFIIIFFCKSRMYVRRLIYLSKNFRAVWISFYFSSDSRENCFIFECCSIALLSFFFHRNAINYSVRVYYRIIFTCM